MWDLDVDVRGLSPLNGAVFVYYFHFWSFTKRVGLEEGQDEGGKGHVFVRSRKDRQQDRGLRLNWVTVCH